MKKCLKKAKTVKMIFAILENMFCLAAFQGGFLLCSALPFIVCIIFLKKGCQTEKGCLK